MATQPPQPGDALTADSTPLFDSLASGYDEHFAAPHRAAYDELAWERLLAVLPEDPAVVLDAGCGTGRWAARLVGMGHRVIGIERAPQMARAARERGLGERFELHEASIEALELDVLADAVVAMGSLQYTDDPVATVARLAGWARSGGTVLVLVDSLVALAVELLRAGRLDEAFERLTSRVGLWQQGGLSASLDLLDRGRLESAFLAAGLEDVRSYGLLVGASVGGRDALIAALREDRERRLALERRLAEVPALADLGKQLLVEGRAP